MIESWDFLTENPYFGSQITYAYGVPAYALSGLLWFIFSIHSINILEGVTIIVNYIILRKWFKDRKDDKWISVLMVLNIFFTIFDAYVAAFSNCLFWLACYGFFEKKKWWPVPLLIAAFNHPYVLISSLFFVVQEPILLLPFSIIFSYFIIASEVFTNQLFLPVYTIFMGIGRIIVNYLPILIMASHSRIKFNHFKIVEVFSKIKVTMPVLLVTLLIFAAFEGVVAIYTLVLQPTNAVHFTMFEGIPNVNGTLRVVDYLYLPSVFVLPYEGFVLQAGSFRENNPQHMVKLLWDNESDYQNFVDNGNFSYVLFCKMCNPQSNEFEILQNYYDLVWDNDYYYLYNVR